MTSSGIGNRGLGIARVASLICLLVSACGSPPSRSAEGTRQDTATSRAPSVGSRSPIRVVFVGTSLTAGLGLDPDSAFPARIQRRADSAGFRIRAVNAGVSGETSAGALRRIAWVLREPAEVVVLETGANDGLRALRVDSTRANIAGIVRRIKAAHPGARIVLVRMEAPPNLGRAYTSAFRDMYDGVAKAEGLTLTPFLLNEVAGVARLNQADGVHPNDAGERIVTETVWKALEPVLRAAGAA